MNGYEKGGDNRGTFADQDLKKPGDPVDIRGILAGLGEPGRLRAVGKKDFADHWEVVTALTDKNGLAEVDLAVSFNPGDNFRVVASLIDKCNDRDKKGVGDLETLAVPTTGKVSDKIPGFGGLATDQLSVWRRFHVETDRMAKTISADKLNGSIKVEPIATGVKIDGKPLFSCKVENLAQAVLEDEYAGGILRINGKNFVIHGNTPSIRGGLAFLASIETLGNPGKGEFTIFQDDFKFDGNNAPTEKVNTEDDSALYQLMKAGTVDRNVNRYADAYLEPEYEALKEFASNDKKKDSFVESIPHFEVTAEDLAKLNKARATSKPGAETDLFWTTYVTTGYEAGKEFDSDPIGELPVLGLTFASFGGFVIPKLSDSQMSVILFETARDDLVQRVRIQQALNPQQKPKTKEEFDRLFNQTLSQITVHEVGHQFGLVREQDMPRGSTFKHRSDVPNIMHAEIKDSTLDNFFFDPIEISALRVRRRSPGPEF